MRLRRRPERRTSSRGSWSSPPRQAHGRCVSLLYNPLEQAAKASSLNASASSCGDELRNGVADNLGKVAVSYGRYLEQPRSATGPWCNGSTTDSGSVSPSSNLGGPASRSKWLRAAGSTAFVEEVP